MGLSPTCRHVQDSAAASIGIVMNSASPNFDTVNY